MEGAEALLDLIVYEENLAQTHPQGDLIAVARAFRHDLLQLASMTTDFKELATIRLLMLATALGPAMIGVTSRQTTQAYDWLLWSVTDTWDLDGEIEIHPGWVMEAFTAPTFGRHAKDVISPWLYALYCYDWQTAGLPYLATTLLSFSSDLAASSAHRGDMDLAGAVLTWGTRRPNVNDRTSNTFEKIAAAVRKTADHETIPRDSRKNAVRILATVPNELTGDEPAARARQLIEQFSDLLHPMESLEAYGSICAGNIDSVLENFDSILDLARTFSGEIVANSNSNPGWARGGTFSLLSPLLVALLSAGRVEEAVQLVGAWQGVDPTGNLQRNVAVLLYERSDGMSWVADGSVIDRGPSGVEDLDVVRVSNKFLGTTLTLQSDPALIVSLPSRGRGIPDDSFGEQFELELSKFLRLEAADRIRRSAEAAQAPLQSLLVIPGQTWPIQSLMLRHSGWSLPISTSLRHPLPDRELRSALLWIGGPMSAEREADVLRYVLEARGVAVRRVHAEEMTKDEFKRAYFDDGYDLMWIGAHGEYDHLEPSEVYLDLPSGETITLADLVYNPVTSNRRLLVINACDSGTSATLGGVPEIGMSAVGASPNQAVISHLWPIDSWTVAPIFATLLAHALTQEKSYFAAYSDTVITLTQGPAFTQARLSAILGSDHPLVRRAGDHADDIRGLAGWGSAGFHQ